MVLVTIWIVIYHINKSVRQLLGMDDPMNKVPPGIIDLPKSSTPESPEKAEQQLAVRLASEGGGDCVDAPMAGGMSSADSIDGPFGSMTVKSNEEQGDYRFVYNMNHPQRGMAIIINNKTFDARTKVGERTGTDVDASYLYRMFNNLGFETSLYNNLTVKDITKLLIQAAAVDHSDVDCFACAILSHGDQGIIYGTDGIVQLETLTTPFKGDKCTSLAGKPKLFFIQACRGNLLDHGVMAADSNEKETGVRRIPSEADFLMAYSTVPGYFSWRNSFKGSWFVQSLIKVFQDYGTEKEIMWLMTRVNRMVAYDFESNASKEYMNKKKQIPSIVSMLTKELYFKPKQKK